jgi:hypothetical protein
VVVDFDVEGRPYSIEFLRADQHVDTSGLVSGRPISVAPRLVGEMADPAGTAGNRRKRS